MIAGHVASFFLPDILWLRIPDRMFVLTFLVATGYNSGHKFNPIIYIGFVIICVLSYFTEQHLPINILGTLLFVRFTLEPLTRGLFLNKSVFWSANIVFIILFPITNSLFEYGTLAYILALAGWINKNQHLVKNIINPLEYFIFALFAYLLATQLTFQFPQTQMVIVGIGCAIMMVLLYHLKTLLLNSIRAKPTDTISRFCQFLGHKSLEIYIFHYALFQIVMIYIMYIYARS